MSIATSEQAVVEKVTRGCSSVASGCEASGGGSFAVEDPSTGEELCQVADATPSDGMAALDAAVAAQADWAAHRPGNGVRSCAGRSRPSMTGPTSSPC
jgi:succinate-semialdehyde dehydrogenase/glutarate-semialdehyde dehydrogenase